VKELSSGRCDQSFDVGRWMLSVRVLEPLLLLYLAPSAIPCAIVPPRRGRSTFGSDRKRLNASVEARVMELPIPATTASQEALIISRCQNPLPKRLCAEAWLAKLFGVADATAKASAANSTITAKLAN
jgi:hypothetical protein